MGKQFNTLVILSGYMAAGAIEYKLWYLWFPIGLISSIALIYRDEKFGRGDWN